MNLSDKQNIVKIFGMTNQIVSQELSEIEREYGISLGHISLQESNDQISSQYYLQFDSSVRTEAAEMAKNYELFYCIEKSMRQLITEIIQEAEGEDWWDSNRVKSHIKEEVRKRMKKERETGMTVRSSEPLDFTTFGELSILICSNWELFGGILKNSKAVEKIMARLNSLRGAIAHCSPLAEDEVQRLHLSLKDWYRQME